MLQRRQPIAARTGMTRRDVLRLGAAAATVGPFFLRHAGAADAFNWQRFAGQSIFVQFIKIPWCGTIEPMLPDFEKLSGIKVEFVELPELQARQKLMIEFTAGSAGIDAFFTALHVEKRRFWKSGWYADLSKFLKDPTMTAPDYDWNDIFAGTRRAIAQEDGSVVALPIDATPHMFYYRKDIFQQKGLKPPKTLEEMEELARALHNPPSMYGFVARGLKNANALAWNWCLFSMGGNFLTKDGKASLNTPEAIKAMDYHTGMLRRFAPPGVVNFNWYECSSAFMQGQVATYLDSPNGVSQFEDKEKSKIAGKVGYAVLPAGPGGHFSISGTDAIGISAQSKKQGPAYLFAQWATSKQSAIKAHLAGTGGARISVWNDPTVKAERKLPAEWAEAFVESLKIARPQLPEIVGVTEYRDIIGLAIQKAIEGAKSSEVLAQAQKEFQELLDKTEK